MDKEVVIVGGGVAGLVLAKELALGGVDVTLHESKSTVSDGAARASGILSVEGLDRIGLDFKSAIVNRVSGAVVHGGGESFTVDAKKTKAYILDRGILAELCAGGAKRAGAKIVMNSRIGKSEIIRISNDDGTVLVGADGAVSTVASSLGFPDVSEHVLTYKAEYSGANVRNAHRVELFFDNSVARRFFGWTVPYSDSTIELGVGISDRSKRNSLAAFGAFVSNPYIKEIIGNAKMTAGYASMIPLGFRKRTVMGNALLVGDAAGQVKATTGGGIIFGASCAKIAAGVIKSNIKNGTPLSTYERLWRKRHILDLEMHRVVHEFYSKLGNRGFSTLIKLSKALGMEDFLGEYGDMDRPSVMLKRALFRNSRRNVIEY